MGRLDVESEELIKNITKNKIKHASFFESTIEKYMFVEDEGEELETMFDEEEYKLIQRQKKKAEKNNDKHDETIDEDERQDLSLIKQTIADYQMRFSSTPVTAAEIQKDWRLEQSRLENMSPLVRNMNNEFRCMPSGVSIRKQGVPVKKHRNILDTVRVKNLKTHTNQNNSPLLVKPMAKKSSPSKLRDVALDFEMALSPRGHDYFRSMCREANGGKPDNDTAHSQIHEFNEVYPTPPASAIAQIHMRFDFNKGLQPPQLKEAKSPPIPIVSPQKQRLKNVISQSVQKPILVAEPEDISVKYRKTFERIVSDIRRDNEKQLQSVETKKDKPTHDAAPNSTDDGLSKKFNLEACKSKTRDRRLVCESTEKRKSDEAYNFEYDPPFKRSSSDNVSISSQAKENHPLTISVIGNFKAPSDIIAKPQLSVPKKIVWTSKSSLTNRILAKEISTANLNAMMKNSVHERSSIVIDSSVNNSASTSSKMLILAKKSTGNRVNWWKMSHKSVEVL